MFDSVLPTPIAEREHATAEQAKFLGAEAWGVVPTKKNGWGVRVRAEAYEALAKRLRPDDHQLITGKIFEISGFPTWVCEDALAQFLSPTTKVLEVVSTKKPGTVLNSVALTS